MDGLQEDERDELQYMTRTFDLKRVYSFTDSFKRPEFLQQYKSSWLCLLHNKHLFWEMKADGQLTCVQFVHFRSKWVQKKNTHFDLKCQKRVRKCHGEKKNCINYKKNAENKTYK